MADVLPSRLHVEKVHNCITLVLSIRVRNNSNIRSAIEVERQVAWANYNDHYRPPSTQILQRSTENVSLTDLMDGVPTTIQLHSRLH